MVVHKIKVNKWLLFYLKCALEIHFDLVGEAQVFLAVIYLNIFTYMWSPKGLKINIIFYFTGQRVPKIYIPKHIIISKHLCGILVSQEVIFINKQSVIYRIAGLVFWLFFGGRGWGGGILNAITNFFNSYYVKYVVIMLLI